jgi:hypothetical protein
MRQIVSLVEGGDDHADPGRRQDGVSDKAELLACTWPALFAGIKPKFFGSIKPKLFVSIEPKLVAGAASGVGASVLSRHV